MLNKSDVRVGNYVLFNNMVFVVTDIELDNVVVKQLWAEGNTGTFTFDEIEGVPISAVILQKHKWVERKPGHYEFSGRRPAGTTGIAGLLDIDFPWSNYPQARVWTFQDRTREDHRGSATVVQCFHQLQNLVYGLLTIELAELIQ